MHVRLCSHLIHVGPDPDVLGFAEQRTAVVFEQKDPFKCHEDLYPTNFSQDVITRARTIQQTHNKAFLFGSITPEENATMAWHGHANILLAWTFISFLIHDEAGVIVRKL